MVEIKTARFFTIWIIRNCMMGIRFDQVHCTNCVYKRHGVILKNM